MLLFFVQIFLVAPVALGQYFPIAQAPLTTYQDLDYYWRDYDGEIPNDAVPAPDSPDDKKVYIGQAMNWPHGTAVVPIYPGAQSVSVFFGDEIETVSRGIQILCSPHPENFYWQDGNSDDFPVEMLSIYPIVAGAEGEESVLYVGKASAGESSEASADKSVLIGKIRQQLVLSQDYKGMYEMHTVMSAVDGSKVKFFDNFSVLIYDDSEILSRDLWHAAVDGGITGFMNKLIKIKKS